ncbi:hypothetical protein, partial [Streptomyces griseoluteus]|uniref:hypothetical protein n=1 Tax=Streptomyces griseoluteus TaxID=29306 RepID=UPI00341EC73D
MWTTLGGFDVADQGTQQGQMAAPETGGREGHVLGVRVEIAQQTPRNMRTMRSVRLPVLVPQT